MELVLPKHIEETAKIFGDALHGDFRARGIIKSVVDGQLSEAISSSDLAQTFAFVNAAALQAQYATLPTTWTEFAKRDIFEDFKPKFQKELVFDYDQDLADNGGHVTAPGSLPVVPELTEYPAFSFTTSAKALSIYKSGARIGFSWEDVINDNWNFIAQLPGRMAQYAKNTEETEAVKVLVTAAGANPDTFNATNLNAVDNKQLSIDSLAYAKRTVRQRKWNNNFITVPKFALVVPSAMRDWAERILKITEIESVSGDPAVAGKGQQRFKSQVSNSDVVLVVNDWLTQIDKSANAGTSWYLVPYQGSDGIRDCVVVNFLRNHEAPEFRQSNAGGLFLGGGAVPTLAGSLRNDDAEYRVRHVVRGGFWFASNSYASTGTTAYTEPWSTFA
jgi:hypothetical protein